MPANHLRGGTFGGHGHLNHRSSQMIRKLTTIAWCVLAAGPGAASAHAFAAPYTLPVPVWMYAYGAAAALVVSFVVVGVFANAPLGVAQRAAPDVAAGRTLHLRSGIAVGAARVMSVFALLLTIVTGLLGNQNPFANLSMTLFWIVFVLGLTYLTAVIGNVYSLINPWRVLCDWIEHLAPRTFRPRVQYPRELGYYPAVVLYMAFIWLELFGHTKPATLALALLIYSGMNFVGAALFGRELWFRYGEFFAVFFRLIGKMAPIDLEAESTTSASGGERFRLRRPFVGLLEERAEHMSLVIFVLFMLSSTAFDGLHETLPWVGVFWKDIYPLLEPSVRALSEQPYAISAHLYYIWQWLSLFLSAFVYFAVYLVFITVTKAIVRSDRPVKDLALQFGFSLVPIAFVYHLTHYYTLLASQGVQIAKLISDPFGVGWDLFGTADANIQPLIIDVNVIWHTQVALILIGHIVSVYLAHTDALRVFSSGRRAMVSQLPMLFLMVILTTAGLWILSLPLAPG